MVALPLAKLQPQLLAVGNIAFTVYCTAVLLSPLQLPLAIFVIILLLPVDCYFFSYCCCSRCCLPTLLLAVLDGRHFLFTAP